MELRQMGHGERSCTPVCIYHRQAASPTINTNAGQPPFGKCTAWGGQPDWLSTAYNTVPLAAAAAASLIGRPS